MAQYISKSALIAEIERRKKYYENIQMIKPVYESNIEDFNELLSFINTLEVKEVDLEKEYKDFIKCDNGRSMFETAKHFFELGLKAQKLELYEQGRKSVREMPQENTEGWVYDNVVINLPDVQNPLYQCFFMKEKATGKRWVYSRSRTDVNSKWGNWKKYLYDD